VCGECVGVCVCGWLFVVCGFLFVCLWCVFVVYGVWVLECV